jgi:chromosome partitioning protein
VSAIDERELLGMQEIAALAGVTRAAVTNWKARFKDFPKPVADLGAGPVFRRDQILSWLKRRRLEMTTGISIINLKGGVAKSTTTVATAQMLDAEFGKRVLVVDLDPQTNATMMLIGDKKWREVNDKQLTVAQMFRDALEQKKSFDIKKAVLKKVGGVNDVRRVDLLPSSLDLIDVQDELGSMNPGRFHASNPVDVLRRAIRPLLDEGLYDFILVDCPPSLGLVTLNGLRISDYFVIPTIPDFLSTYGIPQIISRVKEFADMVGHRVEPLGILATKYRAQSNVHSDQLRVMKQKKDAPMFSTVIPENNDIAGAAEFKDVSTLRQKWGYRGQFDIYRAFTKELLDRVESPVMA